MPDRVSHYAIISTGVGGGEPHSGWYWGANKNFYALFKEYEYPDEAIYRLSERGKQHHLDVGLATHGNLQKVFEHLGGLLENDDHVFLVILGHGAIVQFPEGLDAISGRQFVHPLVGDPPLLAPILGQLVNQHLRIENLTIAVHPCFSGAAIPHLRGPRRVVITSTTETEGNFADWNGTLVKALSLRGRQCGRSILEAHQMTEANAQSHHANEGTPLEHPQLEDCDEGRLAAHRYLGDDGRRLVFSPAAIETLRRRRSELQLD